ncbi:MULTISPECIES: hypothetical protein [unclassified Mesotoga]|uniref:hypothetical protein n=1 Tax=unclassified Mesotoga TaxID=1184398 RepID=UPI000DA6647A|nr:MULTISPECIES: hypothetical protein [unclassified Mesotoga]PZC51753.1 hypothetical protein LH53_09050 [Mesotoga sp. TolDC]
MKKRFLTALSILAIIFLASGCLFFGLPNLNGSWDVVMTYSGGASKTATFHVEQHLVYNYRGGFCLDSTCKELFGMISNDHKVNINTWTSESEIDFAGVAEKGTMSGTFTRFEPSAEGTWEATRR